MIDNETRKKILEVARELSGLKKRLRAVERTAQGRYRSISGGGTTYYDDDGVARVMIGPQDDGAYTHVDLNGPVPPPPSQPVITPGPGALTVTWDGQTSDGNIWPTDFFCVEVHISTVYPFTPTDATEVASFHSPKGGSVALNLPIQEHFVLLTAVSTSGVESDPSLVESGTPNAPAEATTDGLAPSVAATLDMIPGVGSLFFRWTEVTNNDPVRYRLYLRQGSAPTATSQYEVASGSVTFAVIRELADGTTLSAANTYYAMVVVEDDDGVGPASNVVSGSPVRLVEGELDAAINQAIDDLEIAVQTKSKHTLSPNVPGTTANNAGDVWERHAAGDSTKIIGRWRGAGGTSWTVMNLDATYIPQIDIGTGTFGDLTGTRLVAATVGASKLLVTDITNYVGDPHVVQGAGGWWTLGTASAIGASIAVGPTGVAAKGVQLTGTGIDRTPVAPWVPVRAGDTYYATAKAKAVSATGSGSAYYEFFGRTAAGVTQIVPVETRVVSTMTNDTWFDFAGTIVIPTDVIEGYFRPRINATVTGGNVFFTDMNARRRFGGELVVDGSIKTAQLDAGAVTTEKLHSLAITTDLLTANDAFIDALTATDFTAVTMTGVTIQTRPTDVPGGVRLGMFGEGAEAQEGLFVFDNSGVPFLTAVPSTGMAVIAGEVKATTLTVSEGSSLGGITEVTRGPSTAENPGGTTGAIRLTAYATSPTSAPTVWDDHETKQLYNDPVYGYWEERYGWNWHPGTSSYFTAQSNISGSGFQVLKYAADGNSFTASPVIGGTSQINPVGGLTILDDVVYVLAQVIYAGTTAIEWEVFRISPTTLAEISPKWSWNHELDTVRLPGIASDDLTHELLIGQHDPTTQNKLRIRTYDTFNNWPPTLIDTYHSDTSFNNNVGVFYYGQGDYGGYRGIVSMHTGSGAMRVLNGGLTAFRPGEEFPSGMDGVNKVGLTYRPGVGFQSVDNTGIMRTYTNLTTATANDPLMTRWVSNTLARTNRTAIVNTTASSTTIVGTFVTEDVGVPISGPGIPAGATISSVNTAAGTAVISAAATATQTQVTVTVTRVHQTMQSPRFKHVQRKRTRLQVSTSKINTGGENAPTEARIYVGSGSTDPARTAMWQQAPAVVVNGVPTGTYSTLATSGTNPPAANGFTAAAGTVQQIQSADGSPLVDGLGKFPGLKNFVKAGVGSVTVTALNADVALVVTFATPFPTGTVVVPHAEVISSNPQQWIASAHSQSTTGLTVTVRRTAGTTPATQSVAWHAIASTEA